MKYHLLTSLFCFFAIASDGKADYQFLSSYDTYNRYICVVSDNDLKKASEWKPGNKLVPLDHVSAVKIANRARKKLVSETRDFQWQINSITLQECVENRWIWIVEYHHIPKEAILVGVPGSLRIGVLMN